MVYGRSLEGATPWDTALGDTNPSDDTEILYCNALKLLLRKVYMILYTDKKTARTETNCSIKIK